MKILAVSDIESPLLWDHFRPEYLEGTDLILSAGDLDPEYLSFLVTMGHAPLLYVPGNHDGRYAAKPPEGCVNIDGRLVNFQGIRILGLGGSMRYNQGRFQYTEGEMRRRAMRAGLGILRAGGVDILLTHAAARGFCDGSDTAHRGFEVFNTIISKYHPALHIHGHIHRGYGTDFCRLDVRGSRQTGITTVVNAYEKCFLEFSRQEGTYEAKLYS